MVKRFVKKEGQVQFPQDDAAAASVSSEKEWNLKALGFVMAPKRSHGLELKSKSPAAFRRFAGIVLARTVALAPHLAPG